MVKVLDIGLNLSAPFGLPILLNIAFVFSNTASSFTLCDPLQGEQGMDQPRNKFSVGYSLHSTHWLSLH